MFVCKDCGHIFCEDRAEEYVEKGGAEIWGGWLAWEEHHLLCPECGSEHIRGYCGDLGDGDNIADEVDVIYEDEDEV